MDKNMNAIEGQMAQAAPEEAAQEEAIPEAAEETREEAQEEARGPEEAELEARTLLEEPEETREEAKEAGEAQARVRETYDALCALREEGFTLEELRALSTDEAVREDIAQGTPLDEAAYAWRERRQARAALTDGRAHRRGVPTLRAAAPDAPREHDWLEAMSDEEFDRFSRRMKDAALMGRRVRI